MAKKGRCGWGKFRTFQERGEWVELVFMAAALLHGFHALKPWGESRPYDVGIEVLGGLLRVQVKSTMLRTGTGYYCRLRRGYRSRKKSICLRLMWCRRRCGI